MQQPATQADFADDTTAALQALTLFRGLDDASQAEFAQQAQQRKEPKGKVIFLQEDPAQWFYLIQKGWVKLFRETLEGDEAVIDVLTTGHLFGETALFEGDTYSYSAEVVEDAKILALPLALLKKKISSHNELAVNMLTSMSRHRVQQTREIEHLNLQTAPQRIGCFLLRLCKADVQGAVTIHLPIDKTLIASRIGMKPETFSRALAKLRGETGIKVQGPTVYINDVQELVSYTCKQCSTSFPCDDLT